MKGVVYEWYLQKMFGRNEEFYGLAVWWLVTECPTFIEMDVVVINALR